MTAQHGAVGTDARDAERHAAALLRTAAAVRDRSEQLLDRARGGESAWWTVHEEALAATADDVAAVTRARFPDLDIPYHSRWNHFQAGGIDRTGDLGTLLADLGRRERGRAMIDLAVVSVLLDAGAGADWGFVEERDGTRTRFERSEGLAVASWHAFVDGGFSSDPARPLAVDAAALQRVSAEQLATLFQVGPGNPLVGIDGRAALIRRLGAAMADRPEIFGPEGRPGALLDALTKQGDTVEASELLGVLLSTLSPIWLSGNRIGQHPLGDCWRHDAVAGPGLSAGWIPFHKLSQWLTYSLIEPFEGAGVTVTGVESLTGLPEYRNGGLLMDSGVLRLRDGSHALQTWTPADELVVEWRALTVALLDELAPLVCTRLRLDPAHTPLACVLEGGTWAAGRAAAQRCRQGRPPLSISSDGTVF